MYVLASWSLSLVVLPQCSHPRGGGGSCPSCSMRTGNAESPWASQWSLLRGGSWSPGDPRITLHSCSLFFVPRTWPRGLHQWASVPSGFQGGLASGDPGGDGVCWFFNLRLLWVGRVPQSQLLSCPPPHHSGLGVGTPVVEVGWPPVLACLGLSQETCVCPQVLCPRKPCSPGRTGQLVTLGRKTISRVFHVFCPQLGMLSFCYSFSKLHHFASAICFFPGPRLIDQELWEDGVVVRALPL